MKHGHKPSHGASDTFIECNTNFHNPKNVVYNGAAMHVYTEKSSAASDVKHGHKSSYKSSQSFTDHGCCSSDKKTSDNSSGSDVKHGHKKSHGASDTFIECNTNIWDPENILCGGGNMYVYTEKSSNVVFGDNNSTAIGRSNLVSGKNYGHVGTEDKSSIAQTQTVTNTNPATRLRPLLVPLH